MKKHSVISWLLAFFLCFVIAMPALAATSVYEVEAEHDLAVVNEDNVNFDVSELDAFVQEAESEFAKESMEKAVNIQAYSVSDEELPLVFNMTVVGEDYSMTYYKEDGQNAVVYVSESKPVENQDTVLTQE